MRKTTKIAGLVLVGIVVIGLLMAVFALSAIFGGGPEEDSFSHEVEYSIEFRPNGTLNNTEILVPYPEDERFQSAINGDDPNVTMVNELNASLSIAETDRGEMLKLDIEDFTPEPRSERYNSDRDFEHVDPENTTEDIEISRGNVTGIDKYSSYDLMIRISYNRSLDTRNGLEAEPHLRSSNAQCQSPYAGDCATTKAFVSYNTSNDTHAELNVRLEGRNSWWNWGWSGNEYSQRFYNSFYNDDNLVGNQDRWVTLTGRETQGEGNYR